MADDKDLERGYTKPDDEDIRRHDKTEGKDLFDQGFVVDEPEKGFVDRNNYYDRL